MKTGQIILIIIVFIIVAAGINLLLKIDAYTGFFYPNMSNLENYIQSPSSFDSLDNCRDWVDETSFYS